MGTSHLYNQLRDLLGQSSPWADQRHLQTMIWMVIGMKSSECINLTKWRVYVRSRACFAQSHQRRFSRWLHNSRINVQWLYSPLIAAALVEWGNSYLRIGWNWLKGCLHQGWRLFPTLSLQGLADPEPATASEKQAAQQ